MSKVDLKIHVKGIKGYLDIDHRTYIGNVPAAYFIFPQCELFYDHEEKRKLTLFYDNDIFVQTKDRDGNISKIPANNFDSIEYIFDAVVQHNVYGTMRARDICITGVARKE